VTAYVVVAAGLGLLTGIGIGWLLRDWMLRTGHTRVMPFLSRPLSALSTYTKPIGVGLVAVALLSNAALGFLLIDQRAASEKDREAFASLVRCLQDYNELDGRARDEVAAKSTGQTAAAIAWFSAIRDGVQNGTLSPKFLDATTGAYLRTLRETQSARLSNPYPPPDYCTNPDVKRPPIPVAPPSSEKGATP
jgi:hypothetical protein